MTWATAVNEPRGGPTIARPVILNRYDHPHWIIPDVLSILYARGGSALTLRSSEVRPANSTLRCRRDVVGISMTYQHIMPIVLVMNAKPVYQAGTGFVEAVYLYLRAQPAELEHDLIQGADRGNVP